MSVPRTQKNAEPRLRQPTHRRLSPRSFRSTATKWLMPIPSASKGHMMGSLALMNAFFQPRMPATKSSIAVLSPRHESLAATCCCSEAFLRRSRSVWRRAGNRAASEPSGSPSISATESDKVEAVEIHHLVPRRHEVAHKRLTCVVAGIEFRDGSELRVRTEDDVNGGARPLDLPRPSGRAPRRRVRLGRTSATPCPCRAGSRRSRWSVPRVAW